MSTSVHQLLILPGGTVDFLCIDGMSALDVLNIEHLFNFGGELQFVNCGAENIWVAL